MNIDLDSNWINLRGEINGRPGYVRLNDGLRSLIGSQLYSNELIISIQLKQPDSLGMPSEDELARLSQFEDVLRPLLQENMEFLLAVVMTTDGFRDFIFYGDNLDSAVRRLKTIEASFADLQVGVSGKPDDKWTQYRRFAGDNA